MAQIGGIAGILHSFFFVLSQLDLGKMICKSRDPENNNSGEEGAEVEFSGSNPMRWQTERKRKHKKLIHITKFTLCSKTDGTFFIFIHSHTYILLVCTLGVYYTTHVILLETLGISMEFFKVLSQKNIINQKTSTEWKGIGGTCNSKKVHCKLITLVS